MGAAITVGRFSLSAEDVFEGPGDYMADQGNAKLDKIMAGDDAGFNAMLRAKPEADVRTLVLVMMQTDYAGWRGMQQVHSWMGGRRPRVDTLAGRLADAIEEVIEDVDKDEESDEAD